MNSKMRVGRGSGAPSHNAETRMRLALLATALAAALLAVAGTGSAAAQTDTATFSGTVSSSDGAGVDSVFVTVMNRCWWECRIGGPRMPGDGTARPRPLGNFELLGESPVHSTGRWSVTVPAPHNGDPVILVWDREAGFASQMLDAYSHPGWSFNRPDWQPWDSFSGIHVALEAGGQVAGQLTGLPSDGRFAITRHEEWPRVSFALEADPQTGAFVSPAVAPGEYRLAYEGTDGSYLANNDAARVEVLAGRTADAGEIAFLRAGGISGRVTDAAGRGLGGVEVRGRVSSKNQFSSMPSSPFGPSFGSPFTPGASTVFTVTTNDDGTYIAENLVPGDDWQVVFDVRAPMDYTAVAVGVTDSCAIRAGGAIACWSRIPDRMPETPGGQYTGVSAGNYHTCAVATDQTLNCWGDNTYRQAEAPGGQYTAVSAGNYHNCAIAVDQTLKCWGRNWSGQADAPKGQYTAVSAGNYHTCAIAVDQTLRCWGYNSDNRSDPPEGQFTEVSAGDAHTCAIAVDQTLRCWGRNWSGQADAPQGQYTAVSSGYAHTCAIAAEQSLVCWGFRGQGQPGAPQGEYTAVSAGFFYSCAISTDGITSCWDDISDTAAAGPNWVLTGVAVRSGDITTGVDIPPAR